MATATGAAPFDGLYSGTLVCETSGSSPGFTQEIALIVKDSRFLSERGTAGANNWEQLDGAITTDGTLVITGRYIAEVEKPIRYAGRVADRHMTAAGSRGPRRCALSAALPPASGALSPYRGAPDAAARRARLGTPAKSSFTCPELPAPVHDVLVEPFYRKDDPTHSIIDPMAYEARLRAAAPLDQLSARIARLGDAYLRTQPRDPAIAACLFGWMERWARADALLGRATQQGAYERKWTLTTLSLNYLLLADAPEIGPERRRVVEKWLVALAWATLPPYAAKPFAKQNNHLHWAALAVLSTAVAAQDPGLFDWAIAAFKGIIGYNIDADGALPHELKRAGKAMHYHRFALEPLIIAAEIAAANGIDLYAEKGGALHRLAAYTAAAMQDPALIASRVGVVQSVVGADAIKPSMWAWAEPYLARFPDRAELGDRVAGLRGKGLSSAWMGGDMTLRFGRP